MFLITEELEMNLATWCSSLGLASPQMPSDITHESDVSQECHESYNISILYVPKCRSYFGPSFRSKMFTNVNMFPDNM